MQIDYYIVYFSFYGPTGTENKIQEIITMLKNDTILTSGIIERDEDYKRRFFKLLDTMTPPVDVRSRQERLVNDVGWVSSSVVKFENLVQHGHFDFCFKYDRIKNFVGFIESLLNIVFQYHKMNKTKICWFLYCKAHNYADFFKSTENMLPIREIYRLAKGGEGNDDDDDTIECTRMMMAVSLQHQSL